MDNQSKIENLISKIKEINEQRPEYILVSSRTRSDIVCTSSSTVFEDYRTVYTGVNVIVGFAFSNEEANELLKQMNYGYKSPRYYKTPYKDGIIKEKDLPLTENTIKLWFNRKKINKIIENRKKVIDKKIA